MPNFWLLFSVAIAAAAEATDQPDYSPITVEPADLAYKYRSMPSLQFVRWTDSRGKSQQRFIRSFQISADDGSLITRVEYHVSGQLNQTNNWKPAIDATTGRLLSNSTDWAKVNNFFTSPDGSAVIIDERVQWGAENKTRIFVMRHESKDGGQSWTLTAAPVDTSGASIVPGGRDAGRAFQQVIRLPDGGLVMPFYAAWTATKTGGRKLASHLLASIDEGRSWKLVATLFKSTDLGWSESAVVRRVDGKLLMVSRCDGTVDGVRYSWLASRVTQQPIDSVVALMSTQWSPSTPMIVPGAADYPKQVQGVSPALFNLKDGILMMAFGRPRNKLSLSYDGGRTWTMAHSFYDNIPTNCKGSYSGNPCTSLGSSGYMGLAVLDPATVVVTGDNCHTSWGCRPDFDYPHGRGYQLWFDTVKLK